MNNRTRKSTRTLLGVALALGALGLAVAVPNAFGVPAAPDTIWISQPDGTKFEARLWGDEFLHGWETASGYAIILDEAHGTWKYAVAQGDGTLVTSTSLVGIDQPPAGVPKHLRPSGAALREARAFRASAQVTPPSQVVPPTGTANVPVILVNFTDRSTTYNASDINTLLFGTGVKSMRDYYSEVSYGRFTVSAGPAGVLGWYTATQGHDYYGTNNAQGKDQWPGDLVYDAVAAADTAGVNWAPYDLNGDCKVDVVNIVHQGTGEEVTGSPSTDIWSHRWNLFSAQALGRSHHGPYTTRTPCAGGGYIVVDDYVIEPEKFGSGLMTVGVFAHEFGHALGLPDLYDTGSPSDSNGAGNWTIMAGGNWNHVTRNGDTPAHMDAWCKSQLGWVTPTSVAGTLTSQSIRQAETTAEAFKLLPTPGGGTNEYFLVENRQSTGFDAALPGAGLLIWHIDDAQTTNQNQCYPGGPSCATQHYKVALVQADNAYDLEKKVNGGDGADPYPGSTGNTTFNFTSAPSSALYSGQDSLVSVSSISASAATMTATMSITGGGGGGVQTIFSDNFEGSFPGGWQIYPASQTTGWGKSSYRAAGGTYSAWCAAGGTSPQPPGGQYVPNMDSWLIYGPFSLSDATEASLEFDLWLQAESGMDKLSAYVSVDCQHYYGFYWDNTTGWGHATMNFKDITAITAIGAPSVCLAIRFSSDPALQYEGAYVDNVVIKKTVGAPTCTYALSSTSQSFSSAGGTGSFGVTASAPSCAWTASSSAAWITVTGGASGTGNGTVSYSVASNSGGARSGAITAGGQTFTVNQAAGTVSLAYGHWLSAVAHVDVPASNAFWRSDVAVLNRSATTTQLELRLYTGGGMLTMPSSVGPNAQVLFTDVAAQMGLTNGSAALEVRSSQDIFLSGRTYNQVAFDTTYGQDYDGVDATTLLSTGQSAYLTQLTQNGYYRTNIGITNAGTGAASVTVTIYSGVTGGQLYTDTRTYNPGDFYQYNQPLKSLGNTDNAYAKITVNSGSGVFSYASVIDQKTSDATTVVMKR